MNRKLQLLNFIKDLWFEIAFIVWVLLDVSAFFINKFDIGNYFIVTSVKGLIAFFFGIYVFKGVAKNRMLLCYIALVLSWLLGNVFSFSFLSQFDVVYKNFIFFVKFNLLIVFVLTAIKNYSDRRADKLYELVDYLFLFHAMIAIIGFVFQIDFLKSYWGDRFGYTSFITWANDAASLTLIGVLYYYVSWYRSSSQIIGIKLFILLLAFVIIGSKSTLIVGSVIIFTILSKVIKHYGVGVKIVLYGCISLLIFLFLYLVDFFSFYERAYHDLGLLNMLSSLRYDKLVGVGRLILSDYGVTNYLFGTIDFYRYHCESDVVDIFLLLGIVGGGLYVIIGFMTLKPLKSKISIFVFGNILLLSTLAGHFLYNTIIPFYLCALFLKLNENMTSQQSKEVL